MDLIKSYSLVQSNAGCDLIIYFDTGPMDVEFADEFGKLEKENNNLNKNIIQQISEKFPNIKINTVRLMIGTVLVSSFIMGVPAYAEASE